MAKMTPRTLSGFMELLPAPQQQMERIMEVLRIVFTTRENAIDEKLKSMRMFYISKNQIHQFIGLQFIMFLLYLLLSRIFSSFLQMGPYCIR